jgi:5'-nucleotidase
VYVSLQENCAIAIFDLETMQIKDIKPLAAKSWASTNAGLDASDEDPKDASTINMQKWNIHGMLMVDTIDIYKASDGKEYLVTANEGDDKEYEWGSQCKWTEMKRVKSMTASPATVAESAGLAQTDLQDNTKLGNIKAGLFDQRASITSGNYNKIYTMGGRSFSIINPETMAIVYDSGSLMEEILKDHYPTIFNSEANADQPQTDQRDRRCG